MSKICFGCGSKLQSDDVNKDGYIPQNKLESSTYCQRCFRIIHYGDFKETNTPKEADSIINNVNKNANYILFLTDFITLNEDIIKVFKKIKKPKMLVISKSDIIPKSIRFELVIECLKNTYGINDEIRIISSNTGYGINALLNFLYYKKIKEVYVLGETNAGKSSFINKMMDLLDSNLNKITTSKIQNTTLDFIRLKLSNDLTIIDSPGFVLNNRLNWNLLNNSKEINPKVYQMKKDEILSIKGIYFKFSENTNITIYLNNQYEIKKYYKDVLFSNEININDNQDLVLKGVGFINIKSKCTIYINGLNNEFLEIRDSIFGGNHE